MRGVYSEIIEKTAGGDCQTLGNVETLFHRFDRDPGHIPLSLSKRDLLFLLRHGELSDQGSDRVPQGVRIEIDACAMKLGIFFRDRLRHSPKRRLHWG